MTFPFEPPRSEAELDRLRNLTVAVSQLPETLRENLLERARELLRLARGSSARANAPLDVYHLFQQAAGAAQELQGLAEEVQARVSDLAKAPTVLLDEAGQALPDLFDGLADGDASAIRERLQDAVTTALEPVLALADSFTAARALAERAKGIAGLTEGFGSGIEPLFSQDFPGAEETLLPLIEALTFGMLDNVISGVESGASPEAVLREALSAFTEAAPLDPLDEVFQLPDP